MSYKGEGWVRRREGCNASKTHVLLQLSYNKAYTGNRQIWVMISCEITWHSKRSTHTHTMNSSQNGRQYLLETTCYESFKFSPLYRKLMTKKMQLYIRIHTLGCSHGSIFLTLLLTQHYSFSIASLVIVWTGWVRCCQESDAGQNSKFRFVAVAKIALYVTMHRHWLSPGPRRKIKLLI
jgi:hypothetical protein